MFKILFFFSCLFITLNINAQTKKHRHVKDCVIGGFNMAYSFTGNANTREVKYDSLQYKSVARPAYQLSLDMYDEKSITFGVEVAGM